MEKGNADGNRKQIEHWMEVKTKGKWQRVMDRGTEKMDGYKKLTDATGREQDGEQ